MQDRRVQLFNNIMAPYTSRLWAALAAEYQVLVCSCAGAEANRNWADDFSIRFAHVTLPGISLRLNPARYAHLNIGVWRQLRAFRPELVICNGFYPTMMIAALACLFLRIPYIIQNDGWAETMPASPYRGIVRPFMLRHCQGVIACSEKGAAYFRSQGVPAQRVLVVPLAPAWDAPAAVPGHGERQFDLLWVAQVNSSIKNCMFFVEVVAELARRRPGLKVRVVGTGPNKAAMLAALARLPVVVEAQDKVRWDQIVQVFRDARLLLLPSAWEPWGLVCNEAMQCGTPCLVSPHVGAGSELVCEPGGQVLPLDRGAWVAACEHLLEPAAWQAASAAARERAADYAFPAYRDGYLRALARFLDAPLRG